MKSTLILFFFALPVATFANTFRSGEQKLQMLELFSSEGCSSCPPAEKQLYGLRSHSDLWKKFIALNFHVDYWNQLGWTDRFSRDQFTKRQNDYASLWGTSKIYTPEFVLDGKEAGSSFKIFPIPNRTEKNGEITLTSSVQKKVEAEYRRLGSLSDDKFKVYLAVLGNGLESKVNSGENKGELLKHNFVVLALLEKEMIFSKKMEKSTLQFDWPKLQETPPSLSVVAWVIDEKSNQLQQAAGGDLR